MKRQYFRFLAVVALFVLPVASARAADTVATGKRPFLWEIKSGKATVYLLGSMHVARADIYPLDDRIEKAFDASDSLVVEVDASGDKAFAMAGEMMVKSVYPQGDSLDKHISREVYDAASARLAKHGLSIAQMGQLKPWFVAMTITLIELQKLGVEAEKGIDLHFLAKAKGKKKVLELESMDAQVTLLNNFSDKEQEAFLKYTLDDVENLAKSLNDIIAAWKAGDAAGLERLMLKPLQESPELRPVYVKLFDERNKKMAEKIEEQLKAGGVYFVVVGAGHLVGENGLLKLLAKGHSVEQVERSPR